MIIVEVSKTKQGLLIIFTDNGGGIAENIINRVSEPYFTTKDFTKHQGMGLYIAKTLTENVLKGFITFENTHNGLKVSLILNNY